MRRRLAVLASLALVGGLAGTAGAQQIPVPVGVHQGPDGTVCVGISLQLEHCTPPLTAAK